KSPVVTVDSRFAAFAKKRLGRSDYSPERSDGAFAASSAIVHRSSFSITSAGRHDCARWTLPPDTMKHSPVIVHSGVERYATKGETFAGSQRSKPSWGVSIRSPSPGVASVRRVRAPGAIAFDRTPYRDSSLAQSCENVAMPLFAAS